MLRLEGLEIEVERDDRPGVAAILAQRGLDERPDPLEEVVAHRGLGAGVGLAVRHDRSRERRSWDRGTTRGPARSPAGSRSRAPGPGDRQSGRRTDSNCARRAARACRASSRRRPGGPAAPPRRQEEESPRKQRIITEFYLSLSCAGDLLTRQVAPSTLGNPRQFQLIRWGPCLAQGPARHEIPPARGRAGDSSPALRCYRRQRERCAGRRGAEPPVRRHGAPAVPPPPGRRRGGPGRVPGRVRSRPGAPRPARRGVSVEPAVPNRHQRLPESNPRSRAPATTRDEELLASIACAEAPGAGSEARLVLDWLFGRQPESSRTIAVLHFVDGLTLEEVARQTNLSVSGVRKRLRKLRQALTEIER